MHQCILLVLVHKQADLSIISIFSNLPNNQHIHDFSIVHLVVANLSRNCLKVVAELESRNVIEMVRFLAFLLVVANLLSSRTKAIAITLHKYYFLLIMCSPIIYHYSHRHRCFEAVGLVGELGMSAAVAVGHELN